MCKCLSGSVDLIEAILSCLFSAIPQHEKIDINFSIGIACKLTFFFLTTYFSDLSQYSWGQYAFQSFGWLIFHLFIYYEWIYMFEGVSETYQRDLYYKVEDIVQLIVVVAYLILFIKIGDNEVRIIILCLLNFILGIIEIIRMLCHKCGFSCCEYDKYLFETDGGLYEFFIGSLIGSGIMIYLTVNQVQKYYDDIKGNSTLEFMILCSFIGQCVAALGYFIFLCINQYRRAKEFSKSILCLFYGFYNGVFGVYAYGISIFFIFVIFLRFWNEQKYKQQVVPQRNQTTQN